MVITLTYASRRELIRDIVELVQYATLRDQISVASAFSDVLERLDHLHAEPPSDDEIKRILSDSFCDCDEGAS